MIFFVVLLFASQLTIKLNIFVTIKSQTFYICHVGQTLMCKFLKKYSLHKTFYCCMQLLHMSLSLSTVLLISWSKESIELGIA